MSGFNNAPSREVLYNMFLKIFEELRKALEEGKSKKISDVCTKILTEYITKDQLLWCLYYDRIVHGRAEIKEEDVFTKPIWGGITKLIQLIGYYEKILKFPDLYNKAQLVLHSLQEELALPGRSGLTIKAPYIRFIEVDPSHHQYEEILRKREMIDKAIFQIMILEEQENKFWHKYYNRVNNNLKNVFSLDEDNPITNHYATFIIRHIHHNVSEAKQDMWKMQFKKKSILKIESSKEEAREILLSKEGPVLESKISAVQQPQGNIIQAPEGITWKDVTMILKDYKLYVEIIDSKSKDNIYDGEVDITNNDLRDHRDLNKLVPSQKWNILEFIAKKKGILYSDDPELKKNKIVSEINLSKKISELNNCLENIIGGIGEKPIIKTGLDEDTKLKIKREYRHYVKKKAYKTNFNIIYHVGIFPYIIASWNTLSIQEIENNVLLIEAEIKNTRNKKGESYVELKDVNQRYDLFTLDLAYRNNKPNKLGETLLLLLRGQGEIARNFRDEDMINLEKFLQIFFDRTESPFEKEANLWTAFFEASSKVSPILPRD